jgi:ABC-2 type transport system permease protein
MIRLLNAGFTRLRKNKVFWGITIFSIGFALLMIYTEYSDMKKYEKVIEIEQLMLNYATMIGIVIAIFTSLFIGVEYSDGAIRNKISIGHKRTNIYLSNLAITITASLFFYILCMIVVAIAGTPVFGGVAMPMLAFLKLIGSTFVMLFAYSSIFTFLAMIISNKTITSITSIILAFGLMMFAMVCFSIIDMPEYIQSASLVNGEMKFEEIPNPKYPSEQERKVYQTLLDINPAGQGFQLAGRLAPNLKILPIYSLGILVAFTGLGLIIFNKKELK